VVTVGDELASSAALAPRVVGARESTTPGATVTL